MVHRPRQITTFLFAFQYHGPVSFSLRTTALNLNLESQNEFHQGFLWLPVCFPDYFTWGRHSVSRFVVVASFPFLNNAFIKVLYDVQGSRGGSQGVLPKTFKIFELDHIECSKHSNHVLPMRTFFSIKSRHPDLRSPVCLNV